MSNDPDKPTIFTALFIIFLLISYSVFLHIKIDIHMNKRFDMIEQKNDEQDLLLKKILGVDHKEKIEQIERNGI